MNVFGGEGKRVFGNLAKPIAAFGLLAFVLGALLIDLQGANDVASEASAWRSVPVSTQLAPQSLVKSLRAGQFLGAVASPVGIDLEAQVSTDSAVYTLVAVISPDSGVAVATLVSSEGDIIRIVEGDILESGERIEGIGAQFVNILTAEGERQQWGLYPNASSAE